MPEILSIMRREGLSWLDRVVIEQCRSLSLKRLRCKEHDVEMIVNHFIC